MPNEDIRWIQRFSNYRKALARLADKIVNQYHGSFIQLETRLQLEKINQEKNG
ncbi:MAG: hypothetical protein KA303_00220 [Paludibacter sp.]|uniref:hypothetical protein n=1 Tax=Bacteroides sp. TaxID=29523 RepID=UPI001B7CBD92|nr:hypothetical protein [Bacteroides sp.]MBP6355695.1 hypothetical protein [Paludibacter sp.]